MTTGRPRHPEIADLVLIGDRRWRIMGIDGRILLLPDQPRTGDVPGVRIRIAVDAFTAYQWDASLGAWARRP